MGCRPELSVAVGSGQLRRISGVVMLFNIISLGQNVNIGGTLSTGTTKRERDLSLHLLI